MREGMEQKIIDKYGSLEAYRELCRKWGAEGGRKVTENSKNKGFATRRDLASEMGKKAGRGIIRENKD